RRGHSMALSQRADIATPSRHRLEQARRTLVQALSLLLALLASLLVGYLISSRLFVASAPAVASTTAAVGRGNIQATVSATGSAVAATQAKLTFGASGRLAELNVLIGDEVVQGQQLA